MAVTLSPMFSVKSRAPQRVFYRTSSLYQVYLYQYLTFRFGTFLPQT
jgi:hypothetical protein